MPPIVASRDRQLTQTSKSMAVITRFGLRVTIIGTLAAFGGAGLVGGIGFERGLTILLWMSTVLSAVLAVFDREDPLGSTLNHWDESMAYAALCCLASTLEHPLPLV